MRVTYFAHDLSDAAVMRRVRMLRYAGADVRILGFRRTASPIRAVDGIPAVDLGQTFNNRLVARAIQVLRHSLGGIALKSMIAGSDVLLARNLEMATIANAARLWTGSPARLAYECLDLHSTQLGKGIASKALRRLERHILRNAANLIVSSPSFLTHYFDHFDVTLPDVILAENKRVLADTDARRPTHTSDRDGPPWRIGWFGILRCIESFQILLDLARRQPGLVDIELRGRPTAELQSLITEVLPLPNMRFGGHYSQGDLADMYGACDFTWAVEYAGENAQNPGWALGNRLYEGGFYNVPSIVMAHTSMGVWLKDRRTGVLLASPRDEIEPFLMNLTTEEYHLLQHSCADVPTRDLVWTIDDCRWFAGRIAGR